MTNHRDIRIGTCLPFQNGANYIKQILPHGFECFALTAWNGLAGIDLEGMAKPMLDCLGDKATISCLTMFGNPLVNEQHVRDIERCIKSAKLYNCDLVTGFTGAIEGKPLPESLPQFKKVWGGLAKVAEDHGVRLGWENCDMGGWWHDVRWNIAHSPTAWEMLFNEVPSEALGLEWEPCHQMVSLIDPLPNLRQWVSKIFHVHGKDATIAWDIIRTSGIRGGKHYVQHRTPGFGDTNWTQVINILRENKFQGAIDIEGWHDPVYRGDMEMTGQVFGLNYLKQCRGGPFVANPS